MHHLEYLPHGRSVSGVPHVFVDGLRAQGTVLELSHWPGNRTPADLKRDVSTQSVLALLGADEQRRRSLLANATAVTCDHYDIDGLLSVWALTQPALALQHQDLLSRVALCGDFDVYTGAASVRSCLAFLAAEGEVYTNLLNTRPPADAEAATAGLFRGMLEQTVDCLVDPYAWQSSWADEWRDIVRSLRHLDEEAATFVHHPGLDLSVLCDTPEPLHTYAVYGRTPLFHALRLRPDGHHSLCFRYESFIDLRSRTQPPRVRGDVLADWLNTEEANGTWFCESPATATPLLQLYTENQVPGATSYSDEEFTQLIFDFFVEAARNPGLRWSPHPDWIHEAPIAPPSKENV